MKALSKDQTKLIDSKNLLAGITFTLAGKLSQKEAVGIIQDVYYDEIGACGFFRLDPLDKQFYTKDFCLYVGQALESKIKSQLVGSLYKHSLTVKGDVTEVSILQLIHDTEDINEEYEAVFEELEAFKATSACVSWAQFDVNACTILNSIMNDSTVRATIENASVETPEHPWTTIDIRDCVFDALEIDLDLDDTDLFGELLAFFNNSQNMLKAA